MFHLQNLNNYLCLGYLLNFNHHKDPLISISLFRSLNSGSIKLSFGLFIYNTGIPLQHFNILKYNIWTATRTHRITNIKQKFLQYHAKVTKNFSVLLLKHFPQWFVSIHNNLSYTIPIINSLYQKISNFSSLGQIV